jgi:putative RNA 2'-phosphotransferase
MSPSDFRLSKYLARILRHSPTAAGLTLDREGWADVDAVAAAAIGRNLASSVHDLVRVVATNDKQRFAFSSDGRFIRAVQGHSTSQVDLALEAQVPPDELFHGTAERSVAAILQEGLNPARRHYVHLSADAMTAASVGRRHGLPVVLAVDAAGLAEVGHLFFRADNGVWLTSTVPPAFLRQVSGK